MRRAAALSHRRPRRAQYTAPPPDPGSSYIFDGTATGSDASFDKWAFAAGTLAQSRPASQGGQGQATLDPVEGSFLVGASPFGAYWYPVKAFGDAVFRIQYTVQNTPTVDPQRRRHGPHAGGPLHRGRTRPPSWPRSRPASTTTSARARCWSATATRPADSTTYSWAGASGPFPPASNPSDPPFTYSGAYCARSRRDEPHATWPERAR